MPQRLCGQKTRTEYKNVVHPQNWLPKALQCLYYPNISRARFTDQSEPRLFLSERVKISRLFRLALKIIVEISAFLMYNLIKGDLLDHKHFTIRPESKRKISWRDSHVVLFTVGRNLVPDYRATLHFLVSSPTLGNYLDHQLYCMA